MNSFQSIEFHFSFHKTIFYKQRYRLILLKILNHVEITSSSTTLFIFSEMWERFGYYLMIGIFTLYLKDVEAGFGMTEAESADLYGTFIALVFDTIFRWINSRSILGI